MKEVLVKATGFQMKRLRSPAHLFIVVEETVVYAFQTLAEKMPDQFQLMLDSTKGEIAWTVRPEYFLLGKSCFYLDIALVCAVSFLIVTVC